MMEAIMKVLMRMMNLVLPTCRETTRLASQAMDEPLTWKSRIGMRLHLLLCVYCGRHARQLRQIRLLIRKMRGESESASIGDAALSPEARRRISEALARVPPERPD